MYISQARETMLNSPPFAGIIIFWYTVSLDRPGRADEIVADLVTVGHLISAFLNGHHDKSAVIKFLSKSPHFDANTMALVYKKVHQKLPILLANCTTGHDYAHAEIMANPIEMIEQPFLQMSSQIHSIFNLPHDEQRYGLKLVNQSSVLSSDESRFWMAITSILIRMIPGDCFAPGCHETSINTGRRFSKCSGCLRVSYCSKECQTRAWSHESLPHKSVCKVVRKVVTVIELPDKPDAYKKVHRMLPNLLTRSKGKKWGDEKIMANPELVEHPFLHLSSKIHNFSNLPDDQQRYGLKLTNLSSVLGSDESRFRMAITMISMKLSTPGNCVAPGCYERNVNTGRKFSKCSRCSQAYYCSKECQIRAWSHKTLPHKAVCKLLRKVVTLTGLPDKIKPQDHL
ncbi:hypothetical protein C8J56DRAFT_541199 [Mycena floridula]|nr:hypothetical protein C8J56DRAFT_541199 [Mycena floridula]